MTAQGMSQDKERETLETFEQRFGQLNDRFDQKAYPGLEQTDMPSAELPARIEEREAQESLDAQETPHDIWPDEKAQPAFQDAAQGVQLNEASQNQGAGSQQVKDDGQRHNLKPPEDSQGVDRAAHQERMSQDDQFARVQIDPSYYEELEQEADDAAVDREIQAYRDQGQDPGQDRDYGQEYDQSR